ncbi:hypothetical protein DM02DRAFT_92040 [Periconia macrospinosa]|uniref:Kinetochore complex Sim4 subunit Fta1-domain-containing protein n=1 Tax=Periconia macrospinosa TaxID=97972 RepID=A0A2V1DGH7_9PLEO|nr:hypothetical protein DM02DRAFT_92040 [Periconia macrospinosa]
MADIPPYPLFNRTYTLYRVSPLHHGDQPLLHPPSLRTHAKRLKEQLKGDNVRGVEVDYAGTGDALPNLGPLQDCQWELIGDEDAWIDHHRQVVEPDASQLSSAMTVEQARGIQVTLGYEKQSYNALLLRDPARTTVPEPFTHLPLLLVKMPAPVRDIFLTYIRTSFDAHVVPMKLPSAFLTSSLETYFRHLSAPTSTQSIPDVIRQLQIQLSFPNATSLLKHVDITIAGRHVSGFVDRGKAMNGSKDKPFATALSSYIKTHLALDTSHPKVQISKITCGGFTLTTERLKLVAPETSSDVSFESSAPDTSAGQQAVDELYRSLVEEATSTGRFLPQDSTEDVASSTPASAASKNQPDRRKRAISSAAAGNNTTKRSKAKGRGNERRDQEMVDA